MAEKNSKFFAERVKVALRMQTFGVVLKKILCTLKLDKLEEKILENLDRFCRIANLHIHDDCRNICSQPSFVVKSDVRKCIRTLNFETFSVNKILL